MVRNLLKTLLEVQNWDIEIKLFFIVGTHRTLFKVKIVWGVLREVEPIWVMGRFKPSPIIMPSLRLYRVCSERLLKLDVIWWEAPLSKSHDGVLEVLATRWACGWHGKQTLKHWSYWMIEPILNKREDIFLQCKPEVCKFDCNQDMVGEEGDSLCWIWPSIGWSKWAIGKVEWWSSTCGVGSCNGWWMPVLISATCRICHGWEVWPLWFCCLKGCLKVE